MAKNEADKTNREEVEERAMALVFSKEKANPLVAFEGATEKGSVTYSSARRYVGQKFPELSGDAKTAKVNEIVNAANSVAIAAVAQLAQEGFHVRRFSGRELKNGTRSVSVGLTNAGDRAAAPKKKLSDYTSAELLEMAEAKAKAESAVTIEA